MRIGFGFFLTHDFDENYKSIMTVVLLNGKNVFPTRNSSENFNSRQLVIQCIELCVKIRVAFDTKVAKKENLGKRHAVSSIFELFSSHRKLYTRQISFTIAFKKKNYYKVSRRAYRCKNYTIAQLKHENRSHEIWFCHVVVKSQLCPIITNLWRYLNNWK